MKNYVVVKINNSIMVYDTSITKSFSDDQIIASVVSASSDKEDIVDAHKEAIKFADLFENRKYK